MLENLTKKELRTSLGMIETSHKNSLLYGIAILKQLNYSVSALEDKHRIPVSQIHEFAYWSNRQFGEWLVSIGLEAYTYNLECKAIHGAVLFYDSDFDHNELALILQIPRSETSAHRTLKLAQQNLIRVMKSSATKGRRKSFGIFSRKKYSPPSNNNNVYSPSASPDLSYHPHLLAADNINEDTSSTHSVQDTTEPQDYSDSFVITPIADSNENGYKSS